ncbi:hypothetical protein [Sphingomonas sp.]|uniref:hypothetical protein n=1 Tax=Sphingomonas sp. TaxID=28214 RepID=UPI0031DD3E58
MRTADQAGAASTGGAADVVGKEPLDAAEDVLFGLAGVERRLHARAYHHWVSLLGDAPYPSIAALDPVMLGEFAEHSALLDFRGDRGNPIITFFGGTLRDECGGHGHSMRVGDLPPGSLVGRLTRHYAQILAEEAPAGFEAEFLNARGHTTLYRGVLLPYSSDGRTIDFIQVVASWKEVADPLLQARLDAVLLDVESPAETSRDALTKPLWEAPMPFGQEAMSKRAEAPSLGHVPFDVDAPPGTPVVLVGRVALDGGFEILGQVIGDDRLSDRVLRAAR